MFNRKRFRINIKQKLQIWKFHKNQINIIKECYFRINVFDYIILKIIVF